MLSISRYQRQSGLQGPRCPPGVGVWFHYTRRAPLSCTVPADALLFLWWTKQDVTLEEVGQLIYNPPSPATIPQTTALPPHTHTHSSPLCTDQVFPRVQSLEGLLWLPRPFFSDKKLVLVQDTSLDVVTGTLQWNQTQSNINATLEWNGETPDPKC